MTNATYDVYEWIHEKWIKTVLFKWICCEEIVLYFGLVYVRRDLQEFNQKNVDGETCVVSPARVNKFTTLDSKNAFEYDEYSSSVKSLFRCDKALLYLAVSVGLSICRSGNAFVWRSTRRTYWLTWPCFLFLFLFFFCSCLMFFKVLNVFWTKKQSF